MSYKPFPLRPNRRPAGDDGRSGQPAYVQYRETDFEFFNRLTAEEGIFYYVNAEGMLILTDDAATLSGRIQLSYNPNKNAQLQEKTVNRFTHSHKVRTSRAVLRDYTFKKPKWKAEFEVGGGYEHYDYPGRFKDDSDTASRAGSGGRLSGWRPGPTDSNGSDVSRQYAITGGTTEA